MEHNVDTPVSHNAMLRLRNVSASYGVIQAISSVNLYVDVGEIVTIVGANGAGKSTILMTICGIVRAKEGEVYFCESRIDGASAENIVSLGISQVPEGRKIFPKLTVQENLDLGAFLRKDSHEVKNDLDYAFKLFPILKERRHQVAGTLSGGEQQMLAISRALMARPCLLLLDEPSLGLAPLIIQRIFQILTKLNSEHKTTILIVEQNARQALKIAHRGYVMETGRIVLSGTSKELLNHDMVQKVYLGVS